MRDVNHQRKYSDKCQEVPWSQPNTHASTITCPVSMPISYKVFGKYKNIEKKNQSTDTLKEFFNYSNRTVFSRFFPECTYYHCSIQCTCHFLFASFI